jgi:hypothetical protein
MRVDSFHSQREEIAGLVCLFLQIAKEFQRSDENEVSPITIPALALVPNSDHSTVITV